MIFCVFLCLNVQYSFLLSACWAIQFAARFAPKVAMERGMEHPPRRDDAQRQRIVLLSSERRIGAQATAWRARSNTAAADAAAHAAASPEGAAAAAAASAELAQRLQEAAADRRAPSEALLAGMTAHAQPLLRGAGALDGEREQRAAAEAAQLAESWKASPLVRLELSTCFGKLQDL